MNKIQNPTNNNPEGQQMVLSYLSLRTILGVLGIFLPLIIYLVRGEVLPSISFYYYTKSSVFLTSILISFGLLLLTYKGYPRKPGEKLSDNQVTSFGGLMIILVALIPTGCTSCSPFDFCTVCFDASFPLLSHKNNFLETIHLMAAMFFFLSMGFISWFKFSQGERTKINKPLFKLMGSIIFLAVAALILKYVISLTIMQDFNYFQNDTFWLEVLAIEAFGMAWLLKCHILKKGFDLVFGYFSS